MFKRGFVCYASVFRCSRKKCTVKSVERGLVWLVYYCSCLSVFCYNFLFCIGRYIYWIFMLFMLNCHVIYVGLNPAHECILLRNWSEGLFNCYHAKFDTVTCIVVKSRLTSLVWMQNSNFNLYSRSENCEKRLLTSLRPSVRPYGRTRLLLDEFLLNLIFEIFFRESVEKIQVSLKSDKNNWYYTWKRFHIYDNISLNFSYNEKCFRQTL